MGRRDREHANIQYIFFSHDLFLFAFLLLNGVCISPDALQQFLFISSDFLSFLSFIKIIILHLSGLHFFLLHQFLVSETSL